MNVLYRGLLASCVVTVVTSTSASRAVADDDFLIQIVPATTSARQIVSDAGTLPIVSGQVSNEGSPVVESSSAGEPPSPVITPAVPLSSAGAGAGVPMLLPATHLPVPPLPPVPARPEQARHSASEQALTEWERTLEKRRQIVLASGTEAEPAPTSRKQEESAETEHDAERAGSPVKDPAGLARLYSEIYASIPFRRSEYDRNPSYRHDATMELLLGQLRPTVVAPPASDCSCAQCGSCRHGKADEVYDPPYFYRRTYRHYLSIPWYRWLRY